MVSATPDLRLPSQPKLVLIGPTHEGVARLSWPGWLVTNWGFCLEGFCRMSCRAV